MFCVRQQKPQALTTKTRKKIMPQLLRVEVQVLQKVQVPEQVGCELILK
jgi:hypothetical protein